MIISRSQTRLWCSFAQGSCRLNPQTASDGVSRILEALRSSPRGPVLEEKRHDDAAEATPEPRSGVLETYRVPAEGGPLDSAQIFIVQEKGQGRFLVRLPDLSREESDALRILRSGLYRSIPLSAAGSPRAPSRPLGGRSSTPVKGSSSPGRGPPLLWSTPARAP